MASALHASNMRVVDPAVPPSAVQAEPDPEFNARAIRRRLLRMSSLSCESAPTAASRPLARRRLSRRARAGRDPLGGRGAQPPPLTIARPDARKKTRSASPKPLWSWSPRSVNLRCWRIPSALLWSSILYSGERRPAARDRADQRQPAGRLRRRWRATWRWRWRKSAGAVLLIDGDLRKPRLHDIFKVSNAWGLSDLIAGTGTTRRTPGAAFGTAYPACSCCPPARRFQHFESPAHSPRPLDF